MEILTFLFWRYKCLVPFFPREGGWCYKRLVALKELSISKTMVTKAQSYSHSRRIRRHSTSRQTLHQKTNFVQKITGQSSGNHHSNQLNADTSQQPGKIYPTRGIKNKCYIDWFRQGCWYQHQCDNTSRSELVKTFSSEETTLAYRDSWVARHQSTVYTLYNQGCGVGILNLYSDSDSDS